MKRSLQCSFVLLLSCLAVACATAKVDMAEPRRIVGTESAVRIDAMVEGEEVRPGTPIAITYEITNDRPTAIAVAELVPETSYDVDTHTFTVSLGSEVPGNVTLPRLARIGPGEKKTFSTKASVTFILPMRAVDPRLGAQPASFRLKMNFLGETEPFTQLIGIKEVMVADAKLADALFPLWLEHNEVVYTNAIPMRWVAKAREMAPVDRNPIGRRRGGRG